MTEHALDAMMYAWRVMKEKEENKMEYTYVGKIKRSVVNEDNVNLLFIDHGQDISVLSGSIEYDNTPYCLVRANDILINNDKILKLRDEVKRLTDECNDWKARYAKANNELFQKGLAYGTLETEYKNEKIAGGILLKDRDALKEKVDTLEAELDSMRAENKRLRQLMATSMSNLFEGSGITINLTQPNGPESLTLAFDIPELNEAKKKVEDLEKKLAASKSNETFWRDRKEEEEDYHHYWLHTFDRAVKQAAEKGIHIGVCGSDEEDNVGIVTIYNIKAEELETRVVALEKTNNNLDQKYGAADNALEYWNNTYNDIVIAGKKVGVKIDIKGKKPDSNAGFVYVTNEKASDLEKQMVETFADLEKRLAATKSKETYWVHTFNRAVTQAEQKGVYIGVSGNDEENNAGVVIVDNGKANELESQVVQMEDANQKLRQRISAADERIEDLESQIKATTFANDTLDSFSSALTNDYNSLKAEKEDLYNQNQTLGFELSKQRSATEYWRNTYYEIVEKVQDFGVSVDYVGCDSDNNCALLHIRNRNNQKWQAMTEALKAKGVEVIYMGEQDGKPIVDVKITGWEMDKQWVKTFSKRCTDLLADKFGLESERDELKEQCDILRKDGVLKGQQCLKLTADLNALKKEYGRVLSELAELKSETVAEVRYEFKPGCLTLIFTKCDGSKQTISMDSSEAIDANSISCGTIPKCSSCSHFMHNPSRYAHDWCYMPIPKEGGAGYIRKLNKEEAEGPACSDFKAKE